jgi:hypothetical protein
MEQEKKPKVVGYSKYEEVVAERNELKKQILCIYALQKLHIDVYGA